MKKYIITDELQQFIDWKNIMKMPRYAGGHDEQMQGLFKDSIVIGHWNEGDYQGIVATCVQLSNGKYAIYNDWYGSCSGCDSWENADDKRIRNMCINLSNSAHIFETLSDVKEFLLNPDIKEDYDWLENNCAKNLLKEIQKNNN